MAEINLSAMRNALGPSVPANIGAIIVQRPWPGPGGGREVSKLNLFVGQDTIEIWPADPDIIDALAIRLAVLAKEERDRREKEREHGTR